MARPGACRQRASGLSRTPHTKSTLRLFLFTGKIYFARPTTENEQKIIMWKYLTSNLLNSNKQKNEEKKRKRSPIYFNFQCKIIIPVVLSILLLLQLNLVFRQAFLTFWLFCPYFFLFFIFLHLVGAKLTNAKKVILLLRKKPFWVKVTILGAKLTNAIKVWIRTKRPKNPKSFAEQGEANSRTLTKKSSSRLML